MASGLRIAGITTAAALLSGVAIAAAFQITSSHNVKAAHAASERLHELMSSAKSPEI